MAAAQSVSSRLTGAVKSRSQKKTTSSKSKSAAKASVGGSAKPSDDYRPLAFYRKNGGPSDGFNSFEKDGSYYFHYNENGKIVLISEAYSSSRGRDNGIASVSKNMKLKTAYRQKRHKNGKYFFDLIAGNRQEIATSRWYDSEKGALRGAASLRGEKPKTSTASKTRKATKARATNKSRSANDEQNYLPVAAYRKATKGKVKGFEKFRGEDGEYYFTYFENSKLALISEGYPTAAIRDKGQASVEKNMKIEKRYVYGTGAEGKPGFILRAGNHKEIARSVGYGSAAAAAAGAAYLLGTRKRTKPKVTKPKVAKPVPVKTVQPKPKPKPKPVKKKAKPIVPLAAGGVAAAGLGAMAAAAKPKAVEKAAIPVKAAPIKPAPVKSVPVAAPIAAAAVGTAAVAAAAVKAPVTPKATPIAAAPVKPAAAAIPAAAAAIPAAEGGGGIWGWLKWLLLALLALLAMLFLFKACAGGEKAAKVTPVTTTSTTAAPPALITCWNGSKAKNDQACPAKITCWDNSFATQQSACPVQPVAKDFKCWDNSMAVDQAGCPAKPVAAVDPVAPKPKMTAPSTSGRICAPSSNVLFNVTSSRPKSVSYLGSNPQFGESLSLTPDGFYRKLATAYRTSATDRAFLDHLARSLGYGAFANMDASMFSNDTLENGTSGLLGFGSQHALQFSSLNVTDVSNLEAFKVRSANGTDVHFMKRCGNFMYVCEP